MKRGELAKKKRKGCLTALLVVWAVFIVKVIAVLNPGFPEAWRMVEAGQIAGFAYIWLLVFLVLLCCFVLWRIVPKGYFRKKKPETSRPAGEWAVSIPTHENPVVVGNPFRGIFIAGAAGSGKSESVAVPLLLEFIRKGFAGIVYDFKFPALDNDISSFLNATGSDLRHFRLNFSNPYRTDFVNPIQPEYVPNTSYAREYAVSIVANLTKESIKNPDFWSRSATDVLTACIWYLREEHPEICDIPHVRIVSAKAGSNNNDAEKSYDDIELTEWKNDGKLSTAWITYTLERDAEIDDICIKLQGWRSRSYPLEVYAGNTLIWSGNTDKSLGYIHLNVEKPVRANTITIRLKGNTSDKDAFGQIIEVEAIAANTMELEKSSSKHQLRIIEVEFLETIK